MKVFPRLNCKWSFEAQSLTQNSQPRIISSRTLHHPANPIYRPPPSLLSRPRSLIIPSSPLESYTHIHHCTTSLERSAASVSPSFSSFVIENYQSILITCKDSSGHHL